MTTDQELVDDIKDAVARLNDLARKANGHGLSVMFGPGKDTIPGGKRSDPPVDFLRVHIHKQF